MKLIDGELISKYSMKYRVLKSIFLFYSWVVLGFNVELLGPCLEDLRILLEVNYQSVSFALVARNIGFISLTLISGYLIEKLEKYTDFLMAISSVLIIVPTFLIPWIHTYWLSMSLYLLQGFAQAIHDVGGTDVMLRLWTGVSNAPVSLLGAGYAAGALVAVLAAKNFVKFSPANANLQLSPKDIHLEIPYTLAACLGVIEIIGLLIAQYFELKNLKQFGEKLEKLKRPLNNKPIDDSLKKSEECFLKRTYSLIYQEEYSTSKFVIKFILTISLFLLAVSLCGYITVFFTFFVTYLTTGPAHFKTHEAFRVQIAFWISLIIGRLLITFISKKFNFLVVYFLILLGNTLVICAFCLPKVNTHQMAYWPILCTLGLLSGPLLSSLFTLIKHIFIQTSSILISIFCISFCLGSIASQKLAAFMLDEFKPSKEWLTYSQPKSSYIVPFILLFFVLVSQLLFIFIVIFFRTFKKRMNCNLNLNNN